MTYKSQLAAFALMAFVLFGSVMPAFASHDNNDDDEDATCWISARPDSVYEGGTVVLTWGSENADNAWIEDIGDVNTHGSRVVYVDEDTTFKLTVENDRGTGSCETDVDVRSSGHGSSYDDEPGCSIYREETWSGGAILRWTSSNASSAYLSGVGTVPLWGTQAVSALYDRTFTLTVYGNGESQSCEVFVSGTGSYGYPYGYQYPNYQYPAQYPQFSASYPYISLTQIPYTGIDFGSAGNALYWAALLAFALAGGYLLVYQAGVMRLSFVGEVKLAMHNQLRAIRSLFS